MIPFYLLAALGLVAKKGAEYLNQRQNTPSFTVIARGQDEFDNLWLAIPRHETATFRSAYPQGNRITLVKKAIRRVLASQSVAASGRPSQPFLLAIDSYFRFVARQQRHRYPPNPC
jgi:hypothetical protein